MGHVGERKKIGMIWTRVPAVAALACLFVGLAAGCGAAVVSVVASPTTIPGDGKSCSQILVTVLGDNGAPAADGTEVRLTTSAGDITPVVYTSGGRAIGILTAGTLPQMAAVTALSSGASGSVQVEFASPDYETAAGSGTIRIAGGSVAYSVDSDTVVGSGTVSLEYRGLTVKASGAQVCQTTGQIRAQGNVEVRKGDQVVEADALSWDLRTDRIRLLDSGDRSSQRTVSAAGLKQIGEQQTEIDEQAFAPLADANGRSWVVCDRLALIPGEKVLFYRASIYLGDSKVIKMPYYSYSYETRESILQQVRYTSNEGVLVDFPLYYQMSDSKVGALKLRYAANGSEDGGYSTPRRGLSLGLQQEYSLSDSSRGRAFLDALGSSRQAFELSHHLDFGSAMNRGRAELSARYQPSSSYAKGLYNTALNVMGGVGGYSYMVTGYLGGSRIPQYNPLDPDGMSYLNQTSGSVRATFRPKSPIKSASLGRVTPNYSLGYGNLVGPSGAPTSSCLYHSVGFTTNRELLSRRALGISFDSTSAVTLTAEGRTGAGLRAGPTVRGSWRATTASLGYMLNLQGGTTDAASALSRHQLNLNLFLYPGSRLSTSSTLFYGLDSGQLNMYSSLNYRLLKRWQVRSTYNLYRYAYSINGLRYSYGTSYLKIGAYHPLGAYEVGLAWSPDGQDYGLDKSRHMWLELNSGRF